MWWLQGQAGEWDSGKVYVPSSSAWLKPEPLVRPGKEMAHRDLADVKKAQMRLSSRRFLSVEHGTELGNTEP